MPGNKIYIGCILYIMITTSCASNIFFKISNQLEKICNARSANFKGLTFNDVRKLLYKEGYINFMNNPKDTIFIMQSQDIQTWTYFGRIWDKDSSLNFSYSQGKFKIVPDEIYTKFTIELVNRWDTTAIRLEESKNKVTLPETIIQVYRIIEQKHAIINCMSFYDFFDVKRDG